MESRKNTYVRKVASLFLAVIMAVSCFSAAFSAFAANTPEQDRNYNDGNLAANIMGWADATDEQVLEATFDYLDKVLSEANINLDVEQNIVVANISIHAKLRSINDVIELLGNQVPKNIDPLKNLAGDVKQLNLSQIQNIQGVQGTPGVESACGMDYRSTNSAKVLIKHFARFLNDNANSTSSIFYKLLDGTFTLGGIATTAMKGTVYEKLQPMLGTKAGYESDFFYNVTKAMMLSKTGWFKPEEVKKYEDGTLTWNIDTVTRNKVNEMWLNRISAWVTYTIYNHDANLPADQKVHTESSAERLDKIQAAMKDGATYEDACIALGYDPNLTYCTVDTMENNINIFAYGTKTVKAPEVRNGVTLYPYQSLIINEDTTLYSFAAQAFKLAWKTVLKDTLQLVHVNHDNWKQDGTPTNFDNDFFYYMRDNNKWNAQDWKSNYSDANIQAWATDRYPDAKVRENGELRPMKNAQEFIDAAKAEYTNLSRTMIDNPTYTWKDLEIMQFFNKLRYSPLADVYFDVQTGPLNLYLTQTGTPNTNAFLDDFATDLTTGVNKVGILDKFNDGLIAMAKDLFVTSANGNIGMTNPDGTVKSIALPELILTNATANFTKDSADHNDAAKMIITDAVTDNFFMLIEYLLQTSDVNVLANLYHRTGTPFDGSAASYQLNEGNLEDSMLPLLIAAVNEVQIGGQRLMDQIHDETWDKCKSVEEVAIYVLEEHLAWILPDKDYQGLYKYENGVMKATNAFNTPTDDSADLDAQPNLLEDVILVMARDAVGYQLAPILPLRNDPNGDNNFTAWSPYTSEVMTDKTTLFDLLNAVIVFYCGSNEWADDHTQSQGMADLLGLVEKNGNSKITTANDLFQNVDLLVNHLLPFFGVLQNGDMASAGQFDSHELLIEVLVDGALDIASKKDTNKIFAGTATKNYSGLKVFIYQLLTIMSNDLIMNRDIEHLLYDDVLCPLINNVFGARYDTTYPHIIPTSTEMNNIISNGGKTPIDTLFHKQVLVHYNGTNGQGGIGVLGILFDAVNKALGTDNYGNVDSKQGIEGTWQSVAFILQAVANLDPWFVPQLKTHKFGVLESKVTNATLQGIEPGAALPQNTIEFKNNSVGLNRFYKDEASQGGEKLPAGISRQGRYYMHVKSISAVDNNTKESVNFTYGKTDFIVAPQEVARITLDGTAGQKDTTVYRIDATYDVIEKANAQDEGSVLFTDQIATTYYVVSTIRDWWSFTYISSTNMRDNFTDGMTKGKYNTVSAGKTGSNSSVTLTAPKKIIIQMSQPQKVWDASYRLENTSTGMFGSAGKVRGLYFKVDDPNLTATFIPDGSATLDGQPEVKVLDNWKNVQKGNVNELAMAVTDPTTGDILKTDLFDYYHPTEKRWFRGGPNGDSLHAEGGRDSDGAFQGYTQTDINALPDNIKTDPEFKLREHVVWTREEYLSNKDYNKQDSFETVKYVDREQVGVDNAGAPVYRYNFALVRISNALLWGDNGSCSFATPIPGFNMNMPWESVGKGTKVYHTLCRYDGKTELKPMMAGATLVASWDGKSAAMVHVDFEVVDDREVKGIRTQYNDISKEYAPYKSTDFANVDYNGSSVNPYNELQKALGSALEESAKPVTLDNTADFKSDKIYVPATYTTSSQVGAPAYKRASTSDAITEELAVSSYKKTGVTGDQSGVYFYLDEACTIPVLSNKAITNADVTGIANETIDGKSLQTGTTKIGGDKVVKIVDDKGNAVWHYMNAPKYEYAWDTTTYSAPYYAKTAKQVGSDTNSLKYESVTFKKANNKAGEWTNVVPDVDTIVRPNSAPTDYRNKTEKIADTLRYWDEIAEKNIAGGGGDRIVNEVQKAFEPYNNEYINYDVQSFNNVKEVVAEAMSLVKTTWEDDLSKPKMDPLNPDVQLTDKLTGKPLYEKKAVYSTTASSLEVENAISEYNKAISRLIKKDYTDNKLVEEIAWSTAGATKDQITFTKGSNEAGKTIYTEVKAPTAYYGTVENGTIVNKDDQGNQKYTDASWANYINCLGRAVDAAQTYTANGNTRAEGFYARNDLMLAENNLDPFVPTEPEGPTTITISGMVTSALTLQGDKGSKLGVDNIQILVDGQVVATSTSDGSFTATVPVGTTTLVFAGSSTFDRTVTIAGDADIVDANIPVVIGNYAKDALINTMDITSFSNALNGTFNNYCDLDRNGVVDTMDTTIFSSFINMGSNYNPLTIA